MATITIKPVEVKQQISHLYKGDIHLWTALRDVEYALNSVVSSVNAAGIAQPPGQTTPAPGPPPGRVVTSPYVNIDNVIGLQRDNGKYELDVYWTPSKDATAQNFAGVVVYLEDPDISSNTRGHGPIGTKGLPLNNTAQADGAWMPILVTKTTTSPVSVLVEEQAGARNVRIYCASYGPTITDTLIRANDHTGFVTPSVVVQVPAVTREYQSGEEYAWLVSNVRATVLPDYNNPTPTYQLQFFYDPPDPTLPLPPGMNVFGGVRIFYAYLDAAGNPSYPATDSGIDIPVAQAQGLVKSPAYDVGGGGSFWVYFCSEDNTSPLGNHINSLIPGVTPYTQVDILPPGSTGDTHLDITNLQIVSTTFQQQPDGSLWALLTLSWNNPATNLFAGVQFYHTRTDGIALTPSVPIAGLFGGGTKQATLQVQNWPTDAVHVWRIYGVSYLSMGKANDDINSPAHSPFVDWNIGPPASLGIGTEYAPLVSIPGGGIQLPSSSITTMQEISSDGVMMMRFTISGWTNPTSNSFGGVKVAMVDTAGLSYFDADKNTTVTTPWQPALTGQTITFYLVSYNPQGKQNTIQPGVTPFGQTVFVPQPGQVQATLLPTNWFDTTNFAWPNANQGGLFTANIIQANKLFVGNILRVGGAPAGSTATDGSPASSSFSGGTTPNNIGTANGQIAVYSSGTDHGDAGQPQLMAWMGRQVNVINAVGDIATVSGGWFYMLYVGGHSPVTSPFFVNNTGIIQVGGWDVQTALGVNWYPYISIRDKTNLEVARIGARIAYGNPASLGGQGMIVPVGDVADIGGAWFHEIAIGGVNLADWRILWGNDDTLHMRQINYFELDYPLNAPGGTTPYNAPYRFLIGTSQAYPVQMTGYKFPGMTLMRRVQNPDLSYTETTHGITVINRGIVLGSDTIPQLAAFVSFNGDSGGGDADPFWATLFMKSPTTHNVNFQIQSGNNVGSPTFNGSASMIMYDGAGNITFSVEQTGSLFFRHDMYWGPTNTGGSTTGKLMLDGATGNWANGQFSTSVWISVTDGLGAKHNVIDSSGNWIGNPIGGIAQTPWTQNINAANWQLQNVNTITTTNYLPYGNGVSIFDSPTGTLGSINCFGGNGILIAGSNDSPPACLIQPANILMNDASRTLRVTLQSNFTDSSTTNAPVLLMNAANSNPRIQLRNDFLDPSSSNRVPIIGIGYTDTYNGFINISNYQIIGYAAWGTKCFMLENSNGVAGALHLYVSSQSTPYFTLSSGFLYSGGGTFGNTANGFLIFQDSAGAYRSIPYF